MSTEDVKKALLHCGKTNRCEGCPCREDGMLCINKALNNALEAIVELEERVAIMRESMESLEKRCNTLDALEQRCKTLEALEKRLKDPDRINVTHCKDCKHLFDGEQTENCCDVLMEKTGWMHEISVSPDWYCADGETR